MITLLNTSIWGMPGWVLWLVIGIVAAAAEIATINLVSIWFVCGAVVALILGFLDLSFVTQLIVFLAVSIAGLALFLFLVKPRLASGRGVIPTNADRIIGKEGVVIEPINSKIGRGQIRVENQIWSARTEHPDDLIEEGETVLVTGIKGVKAMVRRLSK